MRIQEIVNKNIGKSVLRSKIWYELRDQESKVLASSEDEVLEIGWYAGWSKINGVALGVQNSN